MDTAASATTAIDFNAEYSKAKNKAANPLALKPAQSLLVYNMLQDLRHITILDFRPEFDSQHIRKAFHVTRDNFAKVLLEVLESKPCASNYKGDYTRRVLFVFPSKDLETEISQELRSIDE